MEYVTVANDTPLSKVTATRAADVCRLFELSEDAAQLLDEKQTPAGFLAALIKHDHYADATRFLAHALPKREAVWWACLAARVGLGDKPTSVQSESLRVAEQWVFKPVEENRRPAKAVAEAAKLNNPASWAAMAAFWSSGSLAPPDQPMVPPPDYLYAKAVASAVMLAAVMQKHEKTEDNYRTFLRQGVDIARGGSGRPEGAQL